jgi:hypothetical protein
MDPVAHAAVGLLVKPIVPKAPLWSLILATELPDILFFAFQAAGVEHQAVTRFEFARGLVYLSPAFFPWSHGLAMCVVWSLLTGLIGFAAIRDFRTGIILGLMVFSHWFLDFLSYNNIPAGLQSFPQIGLGLVTSGPGVIIGLVIEAVLIIGGFAVYFLHRKRNQKPRIAKPV